MKLFFATDVHGSETCWKKFIAAGRFYGAGTIILGGDMTGKTIVPIVNIRGDGQYRATFLEQPHTLDGEAEVSALEETIRKRGFYPVRMEQDQLLELQKDPEEAERLFVTQAIRTLERWLEYADQKLRGSGVACYVCPGNDDMFEIDEIIRSSATVAIAEGKTINVDDAFQLVSTGWSNKTPWDTFRECSEDEMETRIEAMLTGISDFSTAIFNFHCPPYNSGLDEAPELDAQMRPKYAGRTSVPVGSSAVRRSIEKHQPALGLFGHIHESRGVRKLDRTVCVNPGSSYEQQILLGALVELDPGRKRIRNWVLTSG